MKKIVLFLLIGFLTASTLRAQKYFGKSFPSTQRVDEYYDEVDIKRPFTVMGKAEMDQGFRSLEKTQKKIIELAKKKGADAIIFYMEEENYGTSTSSGGSISEKKKKTTATSSSNTVALTKKVIRATFIKYD